jgi:hypothetical protein
MGMQVVVVEGVVEAGVGDRWNGHSGGFSSGSFAGPIG